MPRRLLTRITPVECSWPYSWVLQAGLRLQKPNQRAHLFNRITSSFDTDWRFLKGDAAGAEKADFE